MKKILSLMLLSSVAFGRELTLESAIDLALTNEKSIKISEYNHKNSKLDVRKAFKSALPRVVYSAKYNRSEYSTREMIDGLRDKSGFTQSITAYQPLFTGGKVTGGIIGAKAANNISYIMYLAEKRDVRLNTIQLYSNIIEFEKNLNVLNLSKKELEERYRIQKKQLSLKVITKADILKTEVSLLNLEANITQAITNLDVAKKELKLSLNIPSSESINLASFNVPTDLISSIDFNSDLNQALTNSLSSKLAINQVDIAKAEKMAATSNLLPQIDAFVSYGNSRESERIDNGFDDAEFFGGVSFEWDVFNFGSGFDEYSKARNNQKIEILNQEKTIDNITLNMTRSYRELVRLHQLTLSSGKSLESARENLRIDRARFDSGLISTADYLLSESQFTEISVNYNTAILNYYIAFETYRSLLI